MRKVKPEVDPELARVLKTVAHLTAKEINVKSNGLVSVQTIKNWRKHKTKRPHHLTLSIVSEVGEHELMLVSFDEAKIVRNLRKGRCFVVAGHQTEVKKQPASKPRERVRLHAV